jgi:hypothetical protein
MSFSLPPQRQRGVATGGSAGVDPPLIVCVRGWPHLCNFEQFRAASAESVCKLTTD